jgi:hypothetical protein
MGIHGSAILRGFAKSLPFACEAELLSRIGANGEAASACRHAE